LNKADQAADLPGTLERVAPVAAGVPVHAVSALDGRGFEALEPYLAVGRTVALLGPSGAGKSSIVNRLAGSEVFATGEVRPWDARGRHTSVHRQLLVLERGGVLIDTPGLRELQAWDSDEALDAIFTDVDELAASCRFRDCRHDQEPGCAVKAAAADGRLDAGRYDHYLRLARERKALDGAQAERALIDQKREGRIAQKALRSLQKKRER
jgi:ribosome biogenesis GTPase